MSKKKEMENLEKNRIRVSIEHLAKPQLVDLLSQLGSKYPSIAEEIESFANVDRGLRKLNVRDLSSEERICKLADDELTKIRRAACLSKRILYIENLSAQVTREILLNYFERHGDIEECVPVYLRLKDSTVRSAFIRYKIAEAAKNAIKDLDQTTLEGKTITVKYSEFRQTEGGGRQPSVPARVSPIARTAAPYAASPNPTLPTAASTQYDDHPNP